MIPDHLQTRLDPLLEDVAAQVGAIQEAFRTVYGRYWQGARTHSAVPADGATAAPDLSRKVLDQEESWGSFGFDLPAEIEGALSVDVYQTREGHGYVVNAEVLAGGIHYRRAINHGPEFWRGHDWKPFKQTTMPLGCSPN